MNGVFRSGAWVPTVSHVDHTEHGVQVLVTEQGLADLRGLLAEAHAWHLNYLRTGRMVAR